MSFPPVADLKLFIFPSYFVDTESPVFLTNVSNQFAETEYGLVDHTRVSWTEPIASDNSGIYTMTSSHRSGTDFLLGTTLVTYTLVDEAGNTATLSFTVTVNGKYYKACTIIMASEEFSIKLFPSWHNLTIPYASH